jgi:hypothetical protein
MRQIFTRNRSQMRKNSMTKKNFLIACVCLGFTALTSLF